MPMRLRGPLRLSPISAGCTACLLTAGCRSTPLFNILGSFFPAWMVCLIVGVALTLVVRWLLQRRNFEQYLRPLVLVYPALVTLLTCTVWLLLFS
jgi:hypothetical protein